MELNAKTYTFAGVIGNATRWGYRALGLAQLFSWVTGAVTVNTDLPTKKRPSTVKFRLQVPFPVTESSACSCEGDVLGTITGYIDISCSNTLGTAERADFLARLQDLVQTAEFEAAVTSLEQPYA